MKLFLIHSSYQQPGGEDIVFEQECQLLQRGGHEVIIYRRDNWEAKKYSGAGRLQLAKHAVWATDSHRDVAELLRKHRLDVVHIHNTFMMISPSVHWACREADVPWYRRSTISGYAVSTRLSIATTEYAKSAQRTACGEEYSTSAIGIRGRPARQWR